MIIEGKVAQDSLTAPFSKAVADVARKKIALGGELHVDCAEELITDGSSLADIWGVNIYPDGRLDYISLINVRPAQGNRTMELQDPALRAAIAAIVEDALA